MIMINYLQDWKHILFFLQKKVATCNNKHSKLQNSLDKLATDADKEWSLEFLTKELEQLDNQYELS